MKANPANPLTWLASLRLTVVLLALSIYLIFVGTLAQVENGIWQVVHDYFRWGDLKLFGVRTGFVQVPFDVFRSLLYPGSETTWKGGHPFPGGFLIIGLLVVNLLAAHATRFKMTGKGSILLSGWLLIALSSAATAYTVLEPKTSATIQQDVILMLGIWAVPMALLGVGCVFVFGSKKAGIVLIHAGLILMLLGEFITGIGATEGRMYIPEFGASNVIIDAREAEIAFVTEKGDGKYENVVIPESMIVWADKSDDKIVDPALPVSVRIDAWMPNSVRVDAVFRDGDPTDVIWHVKEAPEVTGTEQSEDRPSVMATFFKGDERIAQHLLSTWEVVEPVEMEIDGKVWRVMLRFKNTPLPYTLQLNDFRNDQFTGTRIARNYSSDMRLAADDLGDTRDVYIKMNQPLRYDAKAFFQSGFFQQPLNRNLGTVLQVADNPGAWVPYLSCVIVTLGLTLHFVMSLIKYGRRANAQANAKSGAKAAA